MHMFAILLRLAWRNLWRNYRRTLIMLLAIVLGTWAMIFMTALMRGMVDQMIEDGIDALPGLVQVHDPAYRDDPSIQNSMPPPGPALRKALDSPPVKAWTGRVKVPAMISSERNTRGVTLLGVEPEGEIALGFDRLVAMLCGTPSIRDVIAFPKTQKAACLMTGAPSSTNKEQLEELHLRLRPGMES